MPARLIAILAANVLALFSLLYAAGIVPVVASRTAEPMLLIAHRGDMANHPENTLEAFLGAAELGADGIEMDVWQSASGTWWVMHDPTVDRMTTGSGRIADLTDAELSALRIDAGTGFEAADAGEHRVPTLAEALAVLDGYPGWRYVHLKDPSTTAAEDLGRALRDVEVRAPITVIAPSVDSARTLKGQSEHLRLIVLQDGLGMPEADPAIDGWLTMESRIIRPDIVSGRPYPVELYAAADDGPWDESDSLLRANRFNVHAYITNDLARARSVLWHSS